MSGFVYHDARTDDARLTLAVARTAADLGATVVTRCPVDEIATNAAGRTVGAVVRPDGGEAVSVSAAVVVNAAGVWSDEVRTLDEGRDPRSIRPAKGVHITVPRHRLPSDIAAVLPVRVDRRSVFVVPVGDHTYVGTTDTDHDGSLDDPACTPDDVAYLLAAVNASVTDPLSTDDVVATWAGLRPLVQATPTGKTADLSRRHRVETASSGTVSVTGGKLTTYRRMAADTVDAAVAVIGRGGRSRTARLRLHGADGYDALCADLAGAARRLRLDEATLHHLVHRHGGDARTVAAMISSDPALGERLDPALPHLRAEVVHAARHEWALDLSDILARRLPMRWLDAAASARAAADAAALAAPELGWSDAEAAAEAARYRRSVDDERRLAGLDPVGAGPS